MKSFCTRIGLAGVLLLLSAALLAPAHAQVPRLINYQGSLSDDGAPASGNYAMTFALYNAENGGEQLWSEERDNVSVQQGHFSVQLGGSEGNALPADVTQTSTLYLQVTVGGTNLPRQRLTSTAFALRAGTADAVAPGGAVTSLRGLTGAVNLEGSGAASVNQDGNTITIDVDEGGGGDITAVNAGNGLAGGGDAGDVTLGLAQGATVRSINGLAEAVTLAGTGAATLSEEGNTITINVPEATGGVTTVNAEGGLSATSSTGDVTLSVADGGITGAKLAAGAVTAEKIAADAVTSGKILDGTVGSSDLGESAVTNAKLADGAVSSAKLAEDAAVLSLTTPTSGKLTGDVVLAEGENVDITTDTATRTITIAAESGSLSSIRWKEDVQPLDGALSLVEQLRGVRFTWKEDGQRDLGLIAEEVGEVVPEVVTYEENGEDAKTVNYAHLVAVLVEAIKEQQAQIAMQQQEAEALAERVARLERLMQQAAADSPEPSEDQ